MTSSFRKINYALRPAKHAARRMLCEVFGRVHPFQSVEQYVYVGFGSVWFQDFLLFHRYLGVREMISIERDVSARDRIESNKPFRTVTVHYRRASRVLPRLDWNRRHLVWLDYEDALSQEILFDIRIVASRASSGTVLAVSVPCQRAKEVEDSESDPKGPSAIDRFRTEFGRERVNQAVSELSLVGWPFGHVSREIIQDEIEASLAVRNGGAVAADTISFRSICDIEYDDGTKMTTVVGIFATERDRQLVSKCGFDRLDFMPPRGRLVRIRVPKVTAREARLLEQRLPKIAGGVLDRGQIPAADARAFASLYRYLPSFAVLET
jgi:hypothetical protein